MLTIQEKLNSYLAFIESGEIYDTYPNAKGKVIAIKVMCMYPPDDEGRVFFEKCREVINSAGFNFFYAVKEI